jgi:hypothetical protein
LRELQGAAREGRLDPPIVTLDYRADLGWVVSSVQGRHVALVSSRGGIASIPVCVRILVSGVPVDLDEPDRESARLVEALSSSGEAQVFLGRRGALLRAQRLEAG